MKAAKQRKVRGQIAKIGRNPREWVRYFYDYMNRFIPSSYGFFFILFPQSDNSGDKFMFSYRKMDKELLIKMLENMIKHLQNQDKEIKE